jgi:NAD(P)-dependent dehydrogenase (short-subunit alcohol dehydrogenase family)
LASTGGQRVVVVTGGAAGIGAAIATELGRTGAFVVTVDPMLTLDGSSRLTDTGTTTAERIVAAGGSARASNVSVTDRSAVDGLFKELVAEVGALDAVVNAAGISRATDFAAGAEDDWAAVIGVHLGGYLNVLGAALPLMAAAGHGRILGVTSGSGWRPANTGAYGCAKRAVAALTWQIGQIAPAGVTINALSPTAATRMVTSARAVARATGGDDASRSGGLSLATAPPPEHLGPIGAYLVSEEFAWSSGQVIYSSGSEAAWLTPPRLLEVCRTSDTRGLAPLLETVIPAVMAPVEQAQASGGAGNPRFGAVFDAAGSPRSSDLIRRCAVVTDDADLGAAVGDALVSRGVTSVGIGAWAGSALVAGEPATDFEGAVGQIALAARVGEPIDAVVVAFAGDAGSGSAAGTDWERVLEEHADLPDRIRRDAGWARAVADYSAQADRPVRLVTLITALGSGGRSRAQAAAQHARSAHSATSERIDAFAVSIESTEPTDRRTAAELAAHLLCAPDTAGLAGAELAVGKGWFGLSSHPTPATSIAFGGPALPDWLDGTLRRVITGRSN